MLLLRCLLDLYRVRLDLSHSSGSLNLHRVNKLAIDYRWLFFLFLVVLNLRNHLVKPQVCLDSWNCLDCLCNFLIRLAFGVLTSYVLLWADSVISGIECVQWPACTSVASKKCHLRSTVPAQSSISAGSNRIPGSFNELSCFFCVIGVLRWHHVYFRWSHFWCDSLLSKCSMLSSLTVCRVHGLPWLFVLLEPFFKQILVLLLHLRGSKFAVIVSSPVWSRVLLLQVRSPCRHFDLQSW